MGSPVLCHATSRDYLQILQIQNMKISKIEDVVFQKNGSRKIQPPSSSIAVASSIVTTNHHAMPHLQFFGGRNFFHEISLIERMAD
jgi:hypothetical protein